MAETASARGYLAGAGLLRQCGARAYLAKRQAGMAAVVGMPLRDDAARSELHVRRVSLADRRRLPRPLRTSCYQSHPLGYARNQSVVLQTLVEYER